MTYQEALDFILAHQGSDIVKQFDEEYREYTASEKSATPEELAEFLMGSLIEVDQ